MIKVIFFLVCVSSVAGLTLHGPEGSGTPDRTVKGLTSDDFTLSIEVVTISRLLSPGTSASVVADDKVFNEESNATFVNEYRLISAWTGDADFDGMWESSNPGVANVDDDGAVSYVSEGSVTVNYVTKYGTFHISLEFEETDPGVVRVFDHYLDGSAGAAAMDGEASILSHSDGSPYQIYSTQDHLGAIYVRASNWMAQHDWSGVSPWNDEGGNRKAGVAITDRHLIHAWHGGYTPSIGTVVRFVTEDNAVIERTVTDRARVGDTDFGIVLLDSALPPSIKTYPVLPSDWEDYFPSPDQEFLPLVVFDQEEKALLRRLVTFWDSLIYHIIDPENPELSEEMVSGDSGNPAFLLVGPSSDLVLVGVQYTKSTSSFLSGEISGINATLESLGPSGYSLDTYDMSSFTDFGE
ncbi:MAG: Ig-like domain-containing protein [Verrucomicrobiales bacterium]